MTQVEYLLLGNILLATVVAFFGLALPGYYLVRRFWPESDWNLGGSVGTSAIQPLDLVIAGGFATMFVLNWKSIPESVAKADLHSLTAGKVLIQAVFNLALAAMIPLVMFWRVNVNEFFGLRWDGWRHLFWIVPSFVIGVFLVTFVMMQAGWNEWVDAHYGGTGQEAVTMIQETGNRRLLAAMAFSAVLVAPVAEEIIFRGYLYPVVKRFSERWFAALFTGMLFGVVHFNLMSFPALVVMGVVLVVLYEITGSLWVTIACHAAYNGTTIGLLLLARFNDIPLPK